MVPLTHVIHAMFNRGKEMVKDVITVIHDCTKKTQVIFITDFIERGLVWWKITLFDGPGYHRLLFKLFIQIVFYCNNNKQMKFNITKTIILAKDPGEASL